MAVQRYRVLKKLGEGGCGRTWLVRDRKLGKLWAMKEWREKEGAQEELRILRELESPCFPRIVECFQENGRQYLLMDWIRGRTLEEALLQEGPLPWRTAAAYAAKICGALETLHGGTPAILHLDLKPSNIILTQDGPRLIDFGNAVLADAAADLTAADGRKAGAAEANGTAAAWRAEAALLMGRAEAALPADRALRGTPGYAAPELYSGRGADIRSDVYGLGAVLCAMLTGKKPGPAGNRTEAVPERLWEIVEKAMEEDRESRFQNAAEFRSALETALAETAETAETEKNAGRRKNVFIRFTAAVCAAAAAVTAAAALLLSSGNLQPGSQQQESPQPENPRPQDGSLPYARASEGKTEIGAGKRREAVRNASLWELVWEKEEKGRLLGLQHELGETFRKAAGQRENLSKKADGSDGESAGF